MSRNTSGALISTAKHGTQRDHVTARITFQFVCFTLKNVPLLLSSSRILYPWLHEWERAIYAIQSPCKATVYLLIELTNTVRS